MDRFLWQVTNSNQQLVSELQASCDLTRPAALILANRGLTPSDLDDFLHPALSRLQDPFLMPGAEAAASRLWQAVREREKILIHGDYDVDGITAAVLLSRVLNENGGETEVFIPHRVDDGYGLTPESVKKTIGGSYSLLVSVDCGINSLEAVAEAEKSGVDVIITDHHEPGDELPAALAVINPKLPGTPPASSGLAGVGVAFKLSHAFLKYGRQQGLGGFATDLKEYLDLVALGTVADIVPLKGENRLLVRHGLPVLASQRRPGIRALCEYADLDGKDTFSTIDIGFRLAPRLNAPGRMGKADLSLSLLNTTSMRESSRLAGAVDQANKLRQQEEEEVYQQAKQQLVESGFSSRNVIVIVHHQEWHPGVLGIVASRLLRDYHRPVIVLSREDEETYSGSARSIPGVNIVQALRSVSQSLTRWGGHAMAAGLSVPRKNLSRLQNDLTAFISRTLTADTLIPHLTLDGEIKLEELEPRFFSERAQMEPFGEDNPEPAFLCRGVSPEWSVRAGRNHTRGMLASDNGADIKFIAFNRPPETLPPPPWDLAIKPRINTFRGNSEPQVEILDLRPSSRSG